MDFKTMTIDQLEERKSAIVDTDMLAEGADLDALEAEMRSINAELEQRKAEAAAKEEQRKAIAQGAGEVIAKVNLEERKMDIKEIRNSEAYINAFANYIKTGNDEECRALLTENVSGGTVPVPEMVEGTIRTAWDKEPVMARVRKTYLKGNVKIGFEISATGAVEHTEGGTAVTEETLVLGIATLTPISIKKWISVSDEALDLSGAAFLDYIYSELAYQIAKKCADEIIADILATNGTGSSTVPVQAKISAAVGLATIAQAVAQLSDEASNPVVIMNRLTYADFKAAQANANYGQDIFDGLEVIFNNTIEPYTSADSGDTYAIVGDLGRGVQANFPAGEDITFKFDDKVLMTQDLVRILGRMYCGHGVVAPKTFTQITKPATV